MQPFLIASIFVVALATIAIVAALYRASHNDETELNSRPLFASVIHGDGGHVVVPVQDAAGDQAADKKRAKAPSIKQQKAIELELKVDDSIRRFILSK